jgi:hypothetical protein
MSMTTPSSRIIDAVRELSNALQNAGFKLEAITVGEGQLYSLAAKFHDNGYDAMPVQIMGIKRATIGGVTIHETFTVKWGE